LRVGVFWEHGGTNHVDLVSTFVVSFATIFQEKGMLVIVY
jgi:hypothetical protein